MTQWKLYFAYQDQYNDVELWDYDGSKLTEITPGVSTNNTGLYPSYFDVFGGELIFQGSSGSNVRQMWVSNGTTKGTHAVTGIKGANPGGLFPSYFKTYKNMVLFDGQFGYEGAGGYGLWVTKGTAASTFLLGGSANHEIKNVNPQGLLSYVTQSNGFTLFDGAAYFDGYDKAGNIGLWRTNGTVKGTYEIQPIKGAIKVGTPGSDVQATYLCVLGKRMLFAGEDYINDNRYGLWSTNGSSKGTYEIGGVGNVAIKNAPIGTKNRMNQNIGMDVTDLVAFHGKALFAATDNTIGPNGYYTHTYGLWMTNGTAGGTVELGGHGSSEIKNAAKAQDGGLMSGISNPDFTVFKNEVLFLGVDDKHSGVGGPPAEELWVTNGTVAGTREVGGIGNAGIKQHPIFGSGESSDSPNFTVYDGKVFFTAQDSANNEWAIWTTNGTAAGTHMVPHTLSLYYPNTDFTVGKL